MKRCILLILIMVTAVGAACQLTPEEAAVVNKNDGVLESAIENTNKPIEKKLESYYDKWNEIVKNSNGSDFIKINANVIIPQIEDLPVISVQPSGFTKNEVDNLMEYFSIDGRIYSSTDVMTQEEILEKIITIEADYSRFKNGDDGFDSEITEEFFENQLNDYKKMLNHAPTEAEQIEGSTALILNEDKGREELEVKIDMGNMDLARFTLLNKNQHDYSSSISINNGNRYGIDESFYGEDANGGEVTLEQARKIAGKIIADIGLDNYIIKDIFTGKSGEGKEEYGYKVICVPKINDVAVIYSDMTKIDNPNIIEASDGSGRLVYADSGETVEYVPRRFDECFLEININGNGMSYFLWKNIFEIISVENENVEILDFEEIKKIFIQQMENNFIYNNHENGAVYTVDRIELGLVNIPQRNKIGYFYLVPAWTFYGRCESENGEPLENLMRVYTKYSSHLTINAIDGSLIAD